jgi:hypothetical protein
VTTVARAGSDAIARNQFRVFDRLGNETALSDEDRRRMLRLSGWQWLAWSALRNGGPVPEEPILPTMLRRLAEASYRLAVVAEQMGEAEQAASPALAVAA